MATDLAFDWAIGTSAGQAQVPVALLVPVSLDGRTCTLQLDTGLDAVVAWHGEAGPGPGDDNTTAPLAVRLGSLAHTVAASGATRRQVADCRPGNPVGSIGNGFFEDGTLTLDFPRRRIGYRPGAALADRPDARPFAYRRHGERGGHLLVDLDLGGNPAQALLDTGAAALDFGAFGEPVWRRLTGVAPAAGQAVRTFEAHAWGRQHLCFLAPAAVPLSVGTGRLDAPAITYCPTIGWEPASGVSGVVGMKPFMRQRLVIDYPSRRWLADEPG